MDHYDVMRPAKVQIIRRTSMETYMVRIYTGSLSQNYEFVSVEAEKTSPALDILRVAVKKLKLESVSSYELAEVFSSSGQLCKERRLDPMDNPVRIQLMWPKIINTEMDKGQGLLTGYRFYLRKRDLDGSKTNTWTEYRDDPSPVDNFLTAFLKQPLSNKEYTDLCNLPDLNERTLMENIKSRFLTNNIYTYVGSILIAVNPFKFFPIYNPIYVKMYQNKRLGEMPPHIFAIADAAYHTMLRNKKNQCIVISGESGSGKTESTNLLLHHLTALSQKGSHGSGVEQTILGAGPVLEAFGNAKTVHNNNSSRFGKFIQVNYKENGMVHGAIVEKYLLEKSRIVYQAKNERNYHVFYYLLEGSDDSERAELFLSRAEDYYYLRQSDCYTVDGIDEEHEFARLRQSLETVGFSITTQKRIFSVLSAVLHLGNVEFKKKGEQHHDESVNIKNESTVKIISKLLKVQEKTLVEALTQKKTVAGDETVFINYKMEDALATRDAMAKCLYGALFDWIVLKVNQALLTKRHNSEHQGNSIGVLDIFGFEDFAKNSFEQFCINYANEHLQYYFNQHIFKFEQEEYKREGIQWRNIEFIDNTGCLELFSKRPHGLFCLLDEECNFPGATNETLLTKFNHHHKKNTYYEVPPVREEAFVVVHYAGKVRYGVMDFREKNADHIRQDIVGVLKNSSLSFVRELMGLDPVAVLRWAILRAFFRSVVAFQAAGKKYRASGGSENKPRKTSGTESVKNEDNLLRFYHIARTMKLLRKIQKNKSFRPKHKPPVNFRDIKTLKAIANRTVFGGSTRGFSKNRPPSVGAQFQWSLSRLMETLNQANPFFIRCIKSNADKAACKFDDQIVLRQLRYTGMLATVKIRQSGYNYRLTFEEFIQMYKILLPKGLLSSKDDVRIFLEKLDINHENYQIGINKVFLRETEKILLDESLHRAIMERVVRVQRWMKTILEQRKYQSLRASSVIIQKHIRRFLAQRDLRCQVEAVLVLQKYTRGYLARKSYWLILDATITIQSYCRTYLALKQYKKMVEEKEMQRKLAEEKLRHRQEDLHSSTSDEGILTKGSSAEELEIDREFASTRRQDSEESSGILEDSESETLSVDHKSHSESIPTTPTSPDHNSLFSIQSLSEEKDEFLAHPRTSNRVLDIAKVFQQKLDEHSQDELSPSPDMLGLSFSLSPEKLQAIEDIVKKHKEKQEQEGHELLGSELDKTDSLSPFRRAKNHVKNILGGTKAKKKDLPTDESDDDFEDILAKRPTNPLYNMLWSKSSILHVSQMPQQKLGVSVLPPTPPKPVISSPASSPKSKKENWVGDPVPTTPIQGSHKLKKKRRRSVQKGQQGEKILQSRSNFNLARTAQWQYPVDWVIVDVSELQALDDFIYKKMQDLSKDVSGRRDTIFDVVFKRALKHFRQDLMASISVEIQKNSLNIKYRDLLGNFEDVLSIQVKLEGTNASFPVTMGINAFRGFLDEFMKNHKKKKEEKKVEHKHIKKEKDKKKDAFEHMGHKFSQVLFNIPTFCEFCSSIIWIMEKGQVCQVCKYTCHKKCCIKSNVQCKGFEDSKDTQPSHIFGATLSSLVKDAQTIPVVCDKLISAIELHGLYTQGIYRKSGAVSMVKQLKQAIDSDLSSVDLDLYHVHVLTATLKTFFRELPEPLLSFEQYDHFLRAAEVKDEKEKVQALFAVIDRLPKVNHDLFERLIFHLARVAFHEPSNKMSVNGLAIIYAPCLLRTNKKLQAQETLNHVPRQTKCIETILGEQLKKLRSTFADISTLESAESTASHRLNVVRASMRTPKIKIPEPSEKIIPPLVKEESFDSSEGDIAEEEEKALTAHIESIKYEKDSLKFKLPSLECRHLSSDDDLLSCDDDESQYDTAEEPDDENEEYAVTFDLPVSPPSKLQHLTKRRVTSTPSRRPPSHFVLAIHRLHEKLHDKEDSSQSCTDSFMMDSVTADSMSMPVLRNIIEDDDEIMV